jgi:thiol:disulfide interchange protein DsbD
MAGWVFAVKAFIPSHIESSLFGGISPAESEVYAKPDWHKYSETLIQKAAQEGRPVIIDFKAEWCLACKELELYTFSNTKVLAAGEKFIWLEFDATKSSPELDELKKRYEIRGLPHVVFYDSTGKWRTDLTLNGFEDAEAFYKRIQKVK